MLNFVFHRYSIETKLNKLKLNLAFQLLGCVPGISRDESMNEDIYDTQNKPPVE